MKLIELHILQSFPVTCLNRDDVGAPKSADFGGVPRARVSSQCWKRAIRLMLQESDSATFAGRRTRFVVTALKDLFLAKGQTEDPARTLALTTAEALGKLDSADSGKVKTLLYFSPAELEAVATALLEQDKLGDVLPVASQPDSEDKAQKTKKEKACQELNKLAEKSAKALASAVKDAADIAVFGRMVADDHTLMVEGAGMFSHALSTHRCAGEVDFFSAVDDNEEQSEGAGHIGTLEFNSACYYRYVGLNWDLLRGEHHLGHFSDDERKRVLDAFLRAAVLAVPGARHNSMFGHNPPGFVLGLVRTGQPLSLVNAFEEPVYSNNGYLDRSQAKLLEHFDALKTTYGLDVAAGPRIPDKPLNDFIEEIKQHV